MAEAKYLDAGLSLVSVIPVVGDVIGKCGKLAKRLGGEAAQRVLQALQRVDVVKFLDQFKTHPKLGPYVAQIQEAVVRWVDELKGTAGQADEAAGRDFCGRLCGQDVTLPGVRTRRIDYVKRSEADLKTLRAAFDSHVRGQFLKDLASDPSRIADLRRAGLKEADIADMAAGKVPSSPPQATTR